MLRFALFSPPDEGPPLFKDHLCVNHRVVSQEGDYCIMFAILLWIHPCISAITTKVQYQVGPQKNNKRTLQNNTSNIFFFPQKKKCFEVQCHFPHSAMHYSPPKRGQHLYNGCLVSLIERFHCMSVLVPH